jgi:hypothetical protein
MNRGAVSTVVKAVALAGAALAVAVPASSASSTTVPAWLRAAEQQTLDRVFAGSRPVHTVYISYPRKIAVVFEFNKVSSAEPAARQATRVSREAAWSGSVTSGRRTSSAAHPTALR